MKIILYGTEFCHKCKKVKNFFDENEIRFEYVDVGKDKEAAKKMIERSEQRGVPVIEIDGEMMIDFNEERIKKKLGI